MYKKKSKIPLILAIVILIILIVVLNVLPELSKNRKTEEDQMITEELVETEDQTELPEHTVLIHKTNAGTIRFQSDWLESDGDNETRLCIRTGTLVSMRVTPREGKLLSSVAVYDASDVDTTISSVISELDNGEYNIDFTMPDTDIVMTFQFANEAKLEEQIYLDRDMENEEATEDETETEGSPYGLTLHGVTADLIISYNGQFDDRDFLQQLGDALHVDSIRSEYYSVSDVTFSEEEYTGAKDSDKVYYYIYFNNDSEWKVLSTYYLKEHSYVFTELPKETEEETEEYVSESVPSGSSLTSGNIGGSSCSEYSSGSAVSAGGSVQGGTTETIETSFDIMQVSTVFLAFTGGDNSNFYDQAFRYVLEKGLTGSIVGTMTGYEIDPEKQKATFRIALNTGAAITGTYKKSSNKYSFSGL